MGTWIVNRLNHPVLPLAIALVGYFLFLMVRLETHDAAFFVQAGEHFVDVNQAPDNLFTVTPFTGYDGTFYYRLALTPFTREHTAFGITFDNARYRQQRILYPLLAWFFSFGSPPLAIYALIIVNFLALTATGWLGALYARAAGHHAVGGVLFALYPGFLLTLSRNLTEIVEALFVLAALVALQRHRSRLAASLLALAILAKETAMLVAVALLIQWGVGLLFPVRKTPWPWYLGAIPLGVLILWQAWLQIWWNTSLTSAAQANVGLPLIGLVQGFQETPSVVGGTQMRWTIEVGALAGLGLSTLWSLRRSAANSYEKGSWALYLLLLLVLTSQVWIEDWAFLRAASLFYLFSITILLNSRSSLIHWLLIAVSGTWGALAVHLLYFR